MCVYSIRVYIFVCFLGIHVPIPFNSLDREGGGMVILSAVCRLAILVPTTDSLVVVVVVDAACAVLGDDSRLDAAATAKAVAALV